MNACPVNFLEEGSRVVLYAFALPIGGKDGRLWPLKEQRRSLFGSLRY
jgi:hypothetical protein